jgi:predicted flap endonuclease-1-like 5' DNA nuclease
MPVSPSAGFHPPPRTPQGASGAPHGSVSVRKADVDHALAGLPPDKQAMARNILRSGDAGGSRVSVTPQQLDQFLKGLTPQERQGFTRIASQSRVSVRDPSRFTEVEDNVPKPGTPKPAAPKPSLGGSREAKTAPPPSSLPPGPSPETALIPARRPLSSGPVHTPAASAPASASASAAPSAPTPTPAKAEAKPLQDLSSLSGPPSAKAQAKPLQDLSSLSGPPTTPSVPRPESKPTPPTPGGPAGPTGPGFQGGPGTQTGPGLHGGPGKAGSPINQNVQFIQVNLHVHPSADPFASFPAKPGPQASGPAGHMPATPSTPTSSSTPSRPSTPTSSSTPSRPSTPSAAGKPTAGPGKADPAASHGADRPVSEEAGKSRMGMGAKIAAGLAALGVTLPVLAALGDSSSSSDSDISPGTPGSRV